MTKELIEKLRGQFKLANFLRDKVEIQNTRESFDLAVQAAVHYLKTSPPEVLAEVPGLS